MRIPSQLRRSAVDFNMTPMIDIVFLLIIFFLVSSHLAKQEAQMELPLPIAASGEPERTQRNRRLTLNVNNDGSLWLAGKPVATDELLPRLNTVAAENSQLEIRIRSHRRTPYRLIELVMLTCARSGVGDVTLAVYRPEDAQ